MALKKGPFSKFYVDCVLPTITHCMGDDVVYKPKKGGTFTIRGIYDEKFEQIDADTEELIASNIPSLGINLADLPFPPEQGDEVRLYDGRCFLVTDSREDGLGGSTLLMHRK